MEKVSVWMSASVCNLPVWGMLEYLQVFFYHVRGRQYSESSLSSAIKEVLTEDVKEDWQTYSEPTKLAYFMDKAGLTISRFGR